ncbi:MAG: hypothetical protein RLZZ81_29 [Pseudomonadota bacterium]|jgi:galactitol-specific phosphotransferase system IIB component
MKQDNIPKSVKDRIKEWENKTNMSNNPPKNTKPAVPPKPTSEKIKAWDEGHKKQTDLTTHSQALNIVVDAPSQQVETQKPIILSKPAPEQTKAPEETHKTQSNLTVQEKIEVFFKDHNIDTKDALIPEFSRYIDNAGRKIGDEANKFIKLYERGLEKLIKQVRVPQEKFMDLMEELIKDYPHKDKFDRINQLYRDKSKEQDYSQNEKQSNLTVKEKIEKFFKDHNIDTKDALIPEFSRYIELSKSMEGKRLDVTIKAYEQSLGRLIKQVGAPQKEFISFIEDDLIKNHPHKDKFEKINQHYKLPEPPKLSDIIDNLRELVNSDDIIANLKQSRKHIEFKETVNNLIQIYDDNKHNPAAIAKVETKLKEVGKWCEETTKMDDTPIWKNIGNFIKYSFTGDKTKAAFYKDAIKNSTQNTKKAIAEIQKSLTNPSSHSSNVPPKNKGERYRS